MPRLLVVDDEPSICWAFERLARSLGHSVTSTASAEQAFELAAREPFDAILLDVRLPGIDGLEAMPRLREMLPDAAIVVMTAFGDLATAVRAVRQGASDYLVKPFDLEVAERTLNRVLVRPPRTLDVRPASIDAPGGIVGGSSAMQEVFKRIALVSASDAGVHVVGESGTGKELVARAIHQYSRRADGPFVAVHVASLSESLAEAELFGHVRGAFTGASESRQGLLEQADGGTLFLDEVAEIPLAIQVKLLRALEYGEITPVGTNSARKVDFRVVSATHRELSAGIRAGTFREDLFYRLNTFEIRLPALCDRPEDLPALVTHFVSSFAGDEQPPAIPQETMTALERRPWHGNIRELRNALQHAFILARGRSILPEHLPAPVASTHVDAMHDSAEAIGSAVRRWAAEQWSEEASPDNVHERLLSLVEPPVFEVALKHNHGRFSAAARQLGLHRITLKKRWRGESSSGP